MAVLTIDFGAWLAKVKAALPAEFAPLVDSMAGTMQGWARTQLEAWYALATSDPDAAKAQLLAAMTEAALTAQIGADGARIDADVAANADAMAQQRAWLDRAWQIGLAMAALLLAA